MVLAPGVSPSHHESPFKLTRLTLQVSNKIYQTIQFCRHFFISYWCIAWLLHVLCWFPKCFLGRDDERYSRCSNILFSRPTGQAAYNRTARSYYSLVDHLLVCLDKELIWKTEFLRALKPFEVLIASSAIPAALHHNSQYKHPWIPEGWNSYWFNNMTTSNA